MKWRPIPIIIISLVTMPIVAVLVLTLSGSFIVREPKVYGEVKPFELIERQENRVTLNDLKGKVWIASFIFTSCSAQCPLLMAEAQKIQSALRFKEHFRLVSITIDPERDTPEKLRNYALKFKADPYKWLFLTGKYKDVANLMREGLQMPKEVDGEDLMHSSKFALVDHFGRIRGYYDSNDPSETRQLLKDAKLLIKKAF